MDELTNDTIDINDVKVKTHQGGLCVFAAAIQRRRNCRGRDGGQVRLRFGVFANAKRESDAEERFARPHPPTAEKIKDNPDTICGYDVL